MKAPGGALVALTLVLAATAGCVADGGGGNKNLLSPKLLVDRTPDDRTTITVQAAFQDALRYDRIRVGVDNATAREAHHVYALTHKANGTDLFLTVEAEISDDEDPSKRDVFVWEGHLAIAPVEGRLTVVPWESGGPADASDHDLPFQKAIRSLPQEDN